MPTLVGALRDEGLTVDYEPPIEQGGGGDVPMVAVTVLIGVFGEDVRAATKRAIAVARKKLPTIPIQAKIQGDLDE
jgi:hypothetical protein